MDHLDRPSARPVVAAALVIGALGFTAADLVRRLVEPADPAPMTLAATAASHPAAWVTAGLLSAATPFLLLPGLGVLAATVRGRGARTTKTGAGLLAVGALAATVHAAGYFGMYDVYARADLGPASVGALDAASESSPFFMPFIVLFMAGMLLGPVLLAVGLRRAGLVPVWTIVVALVFVVAGGTGGVPAGVIGLVAFVALAGAVARVLGGRSGYPFRPVDRLGDQDAEVAASR